MVRAAMALTHRVGWDNQFAQRNAWFWPLRAAAEHFASFTDWPTLADYEAFYQKLAGSRGALPLRFAANVRREDKRAQGRVVLEELYDGRIVKRGEVPTREREWHDFFNVACFAIFPLAKRALHTRQFAALSGVVGENATQLPNARTREQDALTLFDEGGAVVAAEPEAAAKLANTPPAERTPLLLQLTSAGRARVVPFGHALFEHMVEGLRCPGGCTQIIALPRLPSGDAALLKAVDAALASALQDPERLSSPRDCAHLRLQDLRADV